MPTELRPQRYEPTPVYALADYLKRKGVDLSHIRGLWHSMLRPLQRPGRNADRVIPIVTDGVVELAVDTVQRATDVSGFLNWCGVAHLEPVPKLQPPRQDLAG